MNREQGIVLHLQSLDQLIEPCAPSPFLRRRLREEAENFIIEHAAKVPRNRKPRFIVYVAEREPVEARDVMEAIHQHFAFRRDEAKKELRRVRRFGWRSLLIALAFLAVAMLVVQFTRRYLPPGPVTSVFQEGVTILAWVALWRPGELLLYEWYPPRRDGTLFAKLERADVQIIAGAKDSPR